MSEGRARPSVSCSLGRYSATRTIAHDVSHSADHLDKLRRTLSGPAYLAYFSNSDLVVVPLSAEWLRIGRSRAADLQFDDPSVPRRHALIVRQPDGYRLLDKRSPTGVLDNGKRVEWAHLADGDGITVGDHELVI
jgi:pSer/pThr/pTyr-binding forkhead associated (FHA) protein